MRVLLLAAGFSAATLAAHAAPLAYVRNEPTAARVSLSGVDFDDRAQVKALHRRLARKAAELCDSRLPLDLAAAASDRACAREALDRAVATIDRPLLTAAHVSRPIAAPGVRLARD